MTKILTVKEYLSNPNRQFITIEEINAEIVEVYRIKDLKHFSLGHCLLRRNMNIHGVPLVADVYIYTFSEDMIHIEVNCEIFSPAIIDYQSCYRRWIEINDIEMCDMNDFVCNALISLKETNPELNVLV